MECGNPGLGKIAAGDQLAHAALQPVLGVGVFGKDQQALPGPFSALLPKTRTKVLADQLLEALHSAVGLVAGCFGDRLHLT